MSASLSKQIDAMADRYPALKPHRQDNMCVWRGGLRPARRTYELKITYRVPAIPSVFHVRQWQPQVQVRSPILERHPEFEDGPLPHVYLNRFDPDYPILCLFDPYGNEWSIDDLLADTTVPWAERWLLNYEYWLATGLWKGGGRHPEGLAPEPKGLSEEDVSRSKRLSPFGRHLSSATSDHAYSSVFR